ncbi:hypothetical protein [Streptomyces sp. NPDC002467]|uniref:hypothetical protein n=1 Tax=Streptomyces sp. NPDC002467 TaxID=3364647 RepID=UPI0036B39E72
MNRHTTRAILALTATAAALTITAPAHAALHTSSPTAHTPAAIAPAAQANEADLTSSITAPVGYVFDLLSFSYGCIQWATSPSAYPCQLKGEA